MAKETANRKLVLLAAGVLLFGLATLLSGCGKGARTRDVWVAELLVTGKESTSRGGKEGEDTVYLIHGENAYGESQTFELTDDALAGKFEASQAFHEIKKDKYYKFGVGWYKKKAQGQEGYYPSIYYTVALKNFSPEEGEEEGAPIDSEEPGKTESGGVGEGAETAKGTEAVQGVTEEEGGEALENAGPIEESVEERLKESFQAEQESLEASMEESFQAERESLEDELERLRESLEGQQ